MSAEEFRAALNEFGLSQLAAAHHLSLSERDVSRMITGRLRVTREVVQKLEGLNRMPENERAILVERLRWAAYEREG